MAARGLEPGGAMAQHLNLEDLIDLGGEKRGDGEGGGLSSSPLLAVAAAAEQTGAGWSLPFAPSPMTGGIELLHSPTPQKAPRSAARSVERSRLGNGSNTPFAPISMNKLDSSPAESEDEVVIHVKARGKTPGARRRQRRSTLSATASADASADAVPPTGRSLLAQSPMPAVQHPASLKVALKTTEACAAKPKTPVSTKPEEGSSVPTLVSHFETIATTPTGDAIDAVPPAGGSKLALTPIAGGCTVPPASACQWSLACMGTHALARIHLPVHDRAPHWRSGGSKLSRDRHISARSRGSRGVWLRSRRALGARRVVDGVCATFGPSTTRCVESGGRGHCAEALYCTRDRACVARRRGGTALQRCAERAVE